MKDIVIFGTGGMAREVHQVVEDLVADGAPWNFLGWLTDAEDEHGTEVHGVPVLGGRAWLKDHPGTFAHVGVGSAVGRRKIVLDLEARGQRDWATLVHPRTWVGNRVEIGPGTIVCAGSNLTTDLSIGNHVIVNLNCTITHDSRLADFVTAAPGVSISGNVLVGEGTDLGTGSTILQKISIGAWSIVGGGAVVSRDLPGDVTAVGVPAKIIKERPEGWHL